MSQNSRNPFGANYFLTGGEVPVSSNVKPGFVLNQRYSLEELLGAGGMGEVYRAKDLLTKQSCALKWIREHLAREEKSRQRFIDELTITQRLSHPGIVRTHAMQYDSSYDVLFYTMELIEGDTLEDWLHSRASEDKRTGVVEQSLSWLQELARILEYAHTNGVLHRDLKPANILIDQHKRLRLTDFGLAKSLDEQELFHTRAVGTPVYMAPEQLRGESASPASDIYSFGVIGYQLLTGRLPQGRFRTPKELVPTVPLHLDQLIMKCLESEPEERISCTSTLLEGLKSPSEQPSLSSRTNESVELAPDGFPREIFSERRECFHCSERVLRKARHCKECGVAFPDASLQREWVAHMEAEAQRLECSLENVLESLEDERIEQLGVLWQGELKQTNTEDEGREWWYGFLEEFRLPYYRREISRRAETAAKDIVMSNRRSFRLEEKKSFEKLEELWKQENLLEHTEKTASEWWRKRKSDFQIQEIQDFVERKAVEACVEVTHAHLRQKQGDVRKFSSYDEAALVFCPPGSFLMGSPEDDPNSWDDEKPQRNVTLSYGFWMLSTPVTQGLWEAVMGNNPSYNVRVEDSFLGFGGTRHTITHRPVEQVSWVDAIHFCNALSRAEGLEEAYLFTDVVEWKGLDCEGYRLPTEAEWEYACRAGSSQSLYDELESIAWCNRNSESSTHDVGLLLSNAFGLHDMIGNVWEWCFDGYLPTAYSKLSSVDPVSPVGSERIRRGGGYWSLFETSFRAAYRGRLGLEESQSNTGFRVVRTHNPTSSK